MADTQTAADRLRPLRPSDVAVWGVGQLRELTDGGKDFLVSLAVGAVGLYLLLPTTVVSTVLVMLAPLTGLQAGYTARVKGAQGWLTERLAVLLSVLVAVVGLVLLFLLGWTLAASLWALGAWELFARRPRQKDAPATPDRWYSHNNLRDVLVRATVLPPLDEIGNPWTLGYRGPFDRNDYGEFQQVELPAPYTHEDVTKKRTRVASAMGLPAARLHLEHGKGKPEGYVTFGVLTEQKALPAAPSIPERTDWLKPVPIGRDLVGQPVESVTLGAHLGIFGATNSGKSWTARYVFTWPLLDVRVSVAFVSGKDVVEDWQPMRDLCVRYAGGAGEENIREALDALRWVERVANYRKGLRPEDRPPLIVGIEEWHMIQLLATDIDTALGKEIGNLVTRLLATVRALNIKMVLIQQKATNESLPTAQRANVTEKLVGMMERKRETGYALGDIDVDVLPSEPGEFLYHRAGKAPRLVHIPPMDETAFLDVVKRAARLRADAVMPTADELEGIVTAQPVVEVVDEGPRPELTRAVHALLRRRPDLSTSQVYDALPEEVRPGGENTLGRWLKEVPHLEQVTVGERKNRTAWRHVPPPRRLPTALPPDEQPVPLDAALSALGSRGQVPPGTASEDAQGASTGTDGPLPRALQVIP